MSPSTPLITDGSAEHSTSASIAGSALQVVELADVAADELDPGLLQARQVELGTAPIEVVERQDLPIGMPGGQGDGEVGADESRPAGDQSPVQGPRRYQGDSLS